MYKVVIIGNAFTGKTSIFKRFVDDEYNENYSCTIGVDFKFKTIQTDTEKIKLQIWDTAGEERHKSLTNAFYRGSYAVIFVYDITDIESFKNVEYWLQDFNNSNSNNALKLLVGNKTDLDSKRTVKTDDAIEFAKMNDMTFIECSAKIDTGIDDIFKPIIRAIIDGNTPQLLITKVPIKVKIISEEVNNNCCQ
jgi:Ras-related protein Rab-1A